MDNGKELREKFKVFISDKKIINLVFFDVELNTERSIKLTKLISDEVYDIFNKDPQKKYHGIIDLSAIKGKISNVPGSVRKIYSDISHHGQLKYVAIIGSGLYYEVVVNLIIQAAGKGENIKWFLSREEAIDWLKGKNGL